jgi:uncharacterized protein involved in exopolysaccharide biosynthesis
MDTPGENRPLARLSHVALSPPPDAVAMAVLQPRRVALGALMAARLTVYALLIVVLSSLTGYGVALLGHKQYGARAEILHQLDKSRPTGFLREDRGLLTQIVVIRSRDVLQPIAEANQMTVDQLAKEVHVTVLENSEILRIEVDDRSPDRALKLVDAISKEYLDQAADAGAADTQRFLQAQIADIDRRQADLTARANQLESKNPSGATPEQVRIQSELQGLIDQRNDLSSRLDEITIDVLRQPRIERLTKPYVLADPVSPKPLRAAAAGAIGGLLIAAAVVTLLVRRRLNHDTALAEQRRGSALQTS